MTLTPRGRAVRRFTIALLLGAAVGLALSPATAATYLLRTFCAVVLITFLVVVVDTVVAWNDRRAESRYQTRMGLRWVEDHGRRK